MDWRDSELSDDESHQDSRTASRKRSSRACDNCRKTKSKCERSSRDSSPCRGCQLAGTACTFLGPSFKRGPPKGYIHAIEQRWHQVESLVGALMQCPDSRVQTVLSELRQDDLAREILARVDAGPYGPSGRRNQLAGATKEDFFASVLKSSESATAIPRDPSRSRRQSRVSREKVSSNQDGRLSVLPTQEWQDSLSRRIARSSPSVYPDYAPTSSSATLDTLGAPLIQRRRLTTNGDATDWSSMYTMESDPEDHDSLKDPTEAIGELSLDENREVRFHGRASGLHLLSNNDRTDNRHEGGIWSLPMARVWPPSKDHYAIQAPQEDDFEVQLPPMHTQDRLIELYFTYIHPAFPVVHKSRFLRDYQARREGVSPSPRTNSSSPTPEPSQKLSPLLLLSIYAIAARFCDDEMPFPPAGKMWEAGWDYARRAQDVLSKICHQSRPSTVQALLLLGYRDFGIGSMEQGWIYIGTAIRMAIDLGLNCNTDTWKMHGHPLFSPEDTQTRRQIWWSCVLADRYGSVYMGRPILIRETDFDVPFPEVYEEEELQLWQPLKTDTINVIYPAVPMRTMSCFTAVAKLAVIVGSILCKIYPVRAIPGMSRRNTLAMLEGQLDQWFISLPPHLQYDSTSKRGLPPPHIVFMHIRYWGVVLLLHRAFIPNWKGADAGPRNSTRELKSFDLAQSAASHISAIANAFRESFTLKRCSPFLTSYILSAGIMHISTLTLRPSNVQAKLGLQQSMAALKEMSVVWPSASRAWDLLNGVKLGFDNCQTVHSSTADRYKRDAEDAFGRDYLAREAFDGMKGDKLEGESGVQDLGSRIMAHMLGLDVPGVEPSTSFLPGYEWWPRSSQNDNKVGIRPIIAAGNNDGSLPAPTIPGFNQRPEGWLESPGQSLGYNFNYYGL